jgi:hypothetical protein
MQRTTHSDFALRKRLAGWVLLGVLSGWAGAAELHVPATVEAGQASRFPPRGPGKPLLSCWVRRCCEAHRDSRRRSADSIQRRARCGPLPGNPLRLIVMHFRSLRGRRRRQPAHLSFFLHPSRVPVSTPDSIDATAFVFDQYFNLVLTPVVDFRITPASGAGFSRQGSRGTVWPGCAWARRHMKGRVQVTAFRQRGRSAGDSTGRGGGLRIAHESRDQRKYSDSRNRSGARLQWQCTSRWHRRFIHQG